MPRVKKIRFRDLALGDGFNFIPGKPDPSFIKYGPRLYQSYSREHGAVGPPARIETVGVQVFPVSQYRHSRRTSNPEVSPHSDRYRFPEPERISGFRGNITEALVKNWPKTRPHRAGFLAALYTLDNLELPGAYIREAAVMHVQTQIRKALAVLERKFDKAYPRERNPRSPGVSRGIKDFQDWHEFDPRNGTRVKVPEGTPEVLVRLGELLEVSYISDKWNKGKRKGYGHAFRKPRPILARGPRDGELYIVGGRFKIRPEGIVG